jgi:hypothetical protein
VARWINGSRNFVSSGRGDRGYSKEQVEFMTAMEKAKRRLGRHLTPKDVLDVAKGLGYRKEKDNG